MFVLRILRWLKGYVVFCGSQGFSERFLNLCRNEKILLWNTRITDGVLRSNIYAGDYKRLRSCARRSGMRLRVSERHGLPFLVKKYRYRSGLFAGFVFLLAFVYVMSSMIWIVEIRGNTAVESERINSVFSGLRVVNGALKSRLDIQEIQRAALAEIPELSWASVNINGCRALIEVREGTKPPEIVDTVTPSNIVASRDGQIIKLEVLEGRAEQKTGAAVLRGDLLISGVTEDKDGTPRVHRARGNVVALTTRELEYSEAFTVEAYALESEKTRYSLYLFSLEIPFGAAGDFTEHYSHTRYAVSGETVLPIGIKRERYSVRTAGETTLTQRQASILALEKYFHLQQSELSSTEITQAEMSFSESADSCCVSGKYICEEKIGEERPIIIE